MKYKYPILRGKRLFFPKDSSCTHCRKKRNKNNDKFATINGGVMIRDRKRNYAVTYMRDDALTFLTLCNQGVTKSRRNLEICRNEGFSQFEFYFCSTKCLRAFFNKLVDDFEKL